MIISHKLKCIFIKTGKTGGTSFEVALSKFCGETDVITPISKKDESLKLERGFASRQNYRKLISEYTFGDWIKLLFKGIKPKKYFNHIKSHEVKNKLGQDSWNQYYKFTIERNPWDKVVSKFFWQWKNKINDSEDIKEQFYQFVLSGEWIGKGTDFEKYSINGINQMDMIVKFENLEEDLKIVSTKLNLPENLFDTMKNIKAKSGHRSEKQPYQYYYNDHAKEIIATAYAREIKILNYQF